MIINLLYNNLSVLTILAILIGFMSALLISMPMHEFAHAFVAYKEGDPTAKAMKRYTLAPFSHVDVGGFLMLLFFGIGYAKPVPVDSRNFKRGRKSATLVAIAGVTTNLILGILSALIYALLMNVWPALFTSYGFISKIYIYFFEYMVMLNFMFAFFNILPIYPLDGFRLVEAYSKPGNGYVQFMRRYGFIILLVVLLTGVLDLYLKYTGYTAPEESMHDLFKVGHTSTSISLATGLAKAIQILYWDIL